MITCRYFDRGADDPLELAQALERILMTLYAPPPLSQQQLFNDLQQPASQYLLAYQGQELIGFMSLLVLMQELEITQLAVAKKAQNQGVASLMLTRVLTPLTIGEQVFLEVRQSNHIAQTLYQKHGFKVYHRRRNYYHSPREDALLMHYKKGE